MAERRRFSGRLVRGGAGILVLLGLLAVAAPLVAPYDPAEQLDPAAGRFLPPLSVREAVRLESGRWLLAERVERTPRGVRIERLGERRLLPDEAVANLAPSGVADRRYFLLGTDRFGRDLWSRIAYGARVSLSIGLMAMIIAVTVGVAVGGIATAGPAADAIAMRVVDAFLAFPRLFLVVALAALLSAGEWPLILILGATGWMGVSRLVRSELVGLKEREFVLAARGLGQGPLAIFFRHLLPNALTPVVVDATLRIGEIVLVEAALSFLGLGVQPPTPSWGNMVADGGDALRTAWWVAAFPGAAIALTVIGCNLLGDGLRDALDPRRRPHLRPGA